MYVYRIFGGSAIANRSVTETFGLFEIATENFAVLITPKVHGTLVESDRVSYGSADFDYDERDSVCKSWTPVA